MQRQTYLTASRSISNQLPCTCNAAAASRQSRRFVATSAQNAAETGAETEGAGATMSANVTNYPFSDSVTFPKATASSASPAEGPYSTMDRVNRALVLPSTSSFRNFFARRHPDRIPPGSIISVETYSGGSTPETSKSTSAFAGVLMAVKRRHFGVDNAFTVRAEVGRPATGTEVRFDVNSPWIKDVKLLRRNDKTRRAKLYYIRRDSRAVSGVQSAIRASALAAAQVTNDANATARLSPPSKSSTKKKNPGKGK